MKNVKLIITSFLTFCLINLQIMTIDLLGMKTVFHNEVQASTDTGFTTSSLTGVAVSVVNMSLKNCKGGTMDILSAMGASVINLVGNMAAFAGNANTKASSEDLSTLKTQEAIDKQIKSTEEGKKALETKQKFELATVAAYLAASGIALAGKAAVTVLESACKSMVAQSVTACEANATRCQQAIASYNASCKGPQASTTGAACRQLYEQYIECQNYVPGSGTPETAQSNLQACKSSLGTVQANVTGVDASLSANIPSTAQATQAETQINTMKTNYNSFCGKAPASTAVESGAITQKATQETASTAAGAAATTKVINGVESATSAYQNFMSWIGSLVTSEKAAQAVDQAADAGAKAGQTASSASGTTTPLSLCSQAGTVACTTFGEQLRNSLAKCTAATKTASNLTPEEKYWFDLEEKIQKSEYAEKYQEIKNHVLYAFTGDETYLLKNIYNKQERILLDNGLIKFQIAIPQDDVETLNDYLSYHERLGTINGLKQSISALSYADMKIIFNGVKNDASHLLKLAANKGIDLMIPQVRAGEWGSLIGAGLNLGSSTGMLQSLIGTQSTFIDNYMVTYGKRSIVFGASSALMGVAAAATKSDIDKLQDQLNKLKKMKAEVEKAAGGGGGGSGSGGGAPSESADAGMNPDISPLKNVDEKDPTVKNAGAETLNKLDQDKIKIGEKDIALENKVPCITSNCESIKDKISDKMKKSGFGIGVPQGAAGILKKGLKLTAEIADELQGKNKIGAGTLSKLDELAKHKNAMQDALRSMEKSLNNMLKDQGKSPIDFETLVNQMAQQMDGNTEKIMLANGMGMNDQMASNSNGKEEKPQNFSMDYKEEQSAEGNNRFAAFNANDPFADKEEKKSDDTASGTDEKANLEQYEDGTVDIVSDTSVPIWTIITTRYVRSALKRLALKPENQ